MRLTRFQKKFMDMAHIFIPSSPPKWCTPDQCVWNGPSVLRKTHILQTIYPDLERLFVTLLEIDNATFEHVNQDLCFLRESYPESLPEEMVALMPQYYNTLSEMLNSEMSVQTTQ